MNLLVSFIKVGDYETAELALREFVDNNSGSSSLLEMHSIGMEKLLELDSFIKMQPAAYLNGYQNYPKSTKGTSKLT